MPTEGLVVTSCGRIVDNPYEYLDITLDEISATERNGYKYPEGIYKAWDARNRALLQVSDYRETFTERFLITGVGEVGDKLYNIPALHDADIMSATIDGSAPLDLGDSAVIDINTTSDDVEFMFDVTPGQIVEILYKKGAVS